MFARRLALAIAVLAGLIGSQGPEFAQQYRQRLGGALEELDRIVAEFDAEAQRENLPPAEALGRLERNADPLARRARRRHAQGDRPRPASERADRGLNSAGPLMRLYVVATNFDPQIARSTLDNYEPAEPLSFGALAAGGLAALWGWAATLLIAWPFRRRSSSPGRARPIAGGQPLIGALVWRTQVKSNVEGLAAIIAAVRPVRVRLSPSESEIVRPDAPLLAWASTAASSSASDMPAVR